VASSIHSLAEFRRGLERLMKRPDMRPFACTGSPLDCELFIVGLNSATTLPHPFWSYWSDETGFDRMMFEADYGGVRKKHGVRPRIERFVKGARPLACLETHIYAAPTPKGKDLRPEDKDPSIFLYLLRAIGPRGIFVHSDEPIAFFRAHTGVTSFCEGRPVPASLEGMDFQLLGLSGPLYIKATDLAENMGQVLACAVIERDPLPADA
jgi:hypothetical protein